MRSCWISGRVFMYDRHKNPRVTRDWIILMIRPWVKTNRCGGRDGRAFFSAKKDFNSCSKMVLLSCLLHRRGSQSIIQDGAKTSRKISAVWTTRRKGDETKPKDWGFRLDSSSSWDQKDRAIDRQASIPSGFKDVVQSLAYF